MEARRTKTVRAAPRRRATGPWGNPAECRDSLFAPIARYIDVRNPARHQVDRSPVYRLGDVYPHRGRVRYGFFRQLTDHSSLITIQHPDVRLFAGAQHPYVDIAAFPELKPLSENWETIRDEAVRLFDEGFIRAAAKNNDWGFYSFFKSGWKRFYLKWYDDFLPSARTLCPKTVELLNSIPSVHGAMFAMLPPGGKLGAHRDPYAGSLRYHLGLATPNAESCSIVRRRQDVSLARRRSGRVRRDVHPHRGEPPSETRLILFCDIDRPLDRARSPG
jgi:beta-hydroxylase